MKEFSMSPTRTRSMVLLLALMLVVALLIPQLTWAAPTTAAVSFSCTGLGYVSAIQITWQENACSHYQGLLELYRTGQLVYHAPGR